MSIQACLRESGVTALINRAMEMEREVRLRDAVVHYLSALDVMVEIREDAEGDDKAYIRRKMEKYTQKVEDIMAIIKREMDDGRWHEQYTIDFDSNAHSYEEVFCRFLTDDLTEVEIEDAYIRTPFQISNFVAFCELLVMSRSPITKIRLQTGSEKTNLVAQKNQASAFNELTGSLKDENVVLEVDYSARLHDREIRFNNGWYVKIGRGLDYFKNPGKYSLGASNQSIRKCLLTTVDIFHASILKRI